MQVAVNTEHLPRQARDQHRNKKAFLQVSSTTVISSQLDEHWEAAIEHLTTQIIELEQSFSFSATVRKALARW
jgi:hypothetical protein